MEETETEHDCSSTSKPSVNSTLASILYMPIFSHVYSNFKIVIVPLAQ